MDETNLGGASNQLRYFFETLVSPTGLLGLGLVIALTIFALVSPRGRWVVLSVMLFATGLMVFVDKSTLFASGGVMDSIRDKGRPLSTALLIALLPITFTSDRGWRTRIVGATAVWLFLFQMACSVRYAIDAQYVRAFVGSINFVLTFAVLAFGLPKWLQTFADVDRLVGAMAIAGVLSVVGSVIEILVSPGAVITNSRFMGMTGNPQHAAVMLSLAILATAYMISRPAAGAVSRNLYRAVIGLEAMFLAWTGSRTGLLMTAVSLAYMYRRRLGKFAGLLLAGAVFMAIGMQFLMPGDVPTASRFDRLMSMEDTRSKVWQVAFTNFWESPIIGHSTEDAGFVENSYLATLSRFGIVGIIPLVIMLLMVFRNAILLRRAQNMPTEFTQLSDLAIAGVVAILIGSVLEAYLLANIGFPLTVLWILLAIQTYLRDAIPHLDPESIELAMSYQAYEQAVEYERA